jgi:hypothetical protein
VLLAVAVPLLVALLVCQPGTGPRLLLVVAAPLLLSLLVCQLGTGPRLLLAVAASLLLPFLVCQPGTSLCVLLVVTVLLLLPGCGGHAVEIVSLAVSGRQPVPGGGIRSSRSASKRNVLQNVHEELQGGELHRHRWLSGRS